MADKFTLDIPLENLQDLNAELKKASQITEDIGNLFSGVGLDTKIILDTQKKLNSAVHQQGVLHNGINTQLQKIVELEIAIRTTNFASLGTITDATAARAEQLRLSALQNDELAKHLSLQRRSAALDASKIALQKIGLEDAVERFSKLKEAWSKSSFHFLVELSGQLIKVFDVLDQSAWEFRKAMGITRKEGEGIDKAVWHAAIGLANVGVKAEHIYGAMSATAAAIGTSQAASLEMSKDMAIMSAQLDIASATSAEFLRTMGQVGGTTMRAQTDMMFFAKAMSQAAGVPLKAVMGDIAAASQSAYHFMSKSPMELVKAAVAAQRLGTNLQSTVKTMGAMMDFRASIEAEMLASVLLGESINLQNLRELSYRRNLKGVNEEILRLAKQAKFEQLDPIQAQHFAAAVNMTTDQIAKMLQAEKEMNAIRSDPALMEQYEELKRIEGMTKDIAENTIQTTRYNLTNQQNQARLTAVTNSWSRIVQKIAEVYMPTIDKVLKFVADTLDWISESPIVTTIAAITVPLMALTTGIAALIGVGAAGAAIGSALGGTLGGLSVGLRALSDPKLFIGIGVLIAATGALALFGLSMKLFSGIDWGSVWAGIGTMTALVAGLTALGGAMAFSFGAGALAFGAGTATIAALGIALLIVGSGMQTVGDGAKSLAAGLGSIQNISLVNTIIQVAKLTSVIYELNDAINDIPDIKMEKLETLAWEAATPTAAVPVAPAVPDETPMMKALDLIKNEVSMLRMDMKAGSITSTVYLDGQLVSIALARSSNFANSIGPNTIR